MRFERLRHVAIVVWAVGVQVHEAVGTVGLALLAASFVPDLPRLSRKALLAWWPVIGFVTWAVLAPLLGGHVPTGAGVARTLDWATVPLVAVAAARFSSSQWRSLAVASFVTLFLSCGVAGLQHFGAWPAEAFFAPLRWTHTNFSRVYEPLGDSGRFMAGGLLFHRLKFTHVSGLVMVAVTFCLARQPRRWPVWVLAVFAFVALWLFPAARLGAVAMTVAMGAVMVLSAKKKGRAALLAAILGLAAVGAVFVIAPLRARFVSSFSDAGSGQRSQHLEAGFAAIRAAPLVGVGAGQFRPSKFGGPDMAEHVRDNPGKAHNEFVSMAAETGIPGGLAFVALLGWLAWRARARPFGVLTLGALTQFVVLSLAHDPLFQAPYSMGLALLLGLGLSGARPAE